MIPVFVTAALSGGGPVLTLSGGNLPAGNSGAICTAQFKVDNDGNMYSRVNNTVWNQISSTTDWVRPASASPGSYEVRYTNASGDTGFLSATTAEDTWHPMTTGDWIITITDDTPIGATQSSATFDIEIRIGSSGSAAVSASYTLTANRDDF